MIIAKGIGKARRLIRQARYRSKTVGFIPTMGALHAGHLSLVSAARKECGFVVTSIFVNPKQFGPKEDFRRYPRRVKKDKELLKEEGVDLLFCPETATVYSNNFSTYVEENSPLSRVLCGRSRPGHFKGVCTVVAKLFNIIQPDVAYFGQKDYQQAQIIRRMVADLNFPIKLRILPIVREKDGLAMSSRNRYLKSKERKEAACLFSALQSAKKLITGGERNPKKVIGRIRKEVASKKNVRIDYVKIVDPRTLEDLKRIKKNVLVALAVYLGGVRLIDNIILHLRR